MEINLNANKKIALNKDSVNLAVQRYRDYLLPTGVVAVCLILLFFVIFPQFQNFLSSRAQLDKETQNLTVLKNNYNFLTSLDDDKNNQDLKSLSYALPSGKDFTGIINAISVASSKTGALVGNYSFSLGNLNKQDDISSFLPVVQMELNLTGNAKITTDFINELYKTAPVSEIKSVKLNLNSAKLIILFYYKPYPPQNVSDSAAVVQISASNIALLKQVEAWNNINGGDVFIFPIASGSGNLSTNSAGLNPSPF